MRYVVLEYADRPAITVAVCKTEEQARDIALKVAWANRAGDGKVTVMKRESTDQLQMSQKGPVRDQPHLPAYGEDLTIHVPDAARLKGTYK